MPTTATTTYSADKLDPIYDPELAKLIHVKLQASTTFAKGTVLGEVTATPGTYAPYDDAVATGAQVARVILQYACITDASNNITYGTATGGGAWGETYLTAPVYYRGSFKTSELPQSGAGSIDAAAVVDLGRLISGTTADGVLLIG